MKIKSTNPIAALFGSSPFKPLQDHMAVVVRCAGEVPGLFEALIVNDMAEVKKSRDAIFLLEQEADELKNQLRVHLPKSLFMPVDRRDLLEVLDAQDSIADTAQDIAGLLMQRDMPVPEPMVENLRSLTNRCVDTCELANKIINELDELVEMGFRGREVDLVEEMLNQLNLVEDETDVLGVELTKTLFEHEDSMNPVSVMFWYQLIEWIGDLADYAEKVGNRLRLLIAR